MHYYMHYIGALLYVNTLLHHRVILLYYTCNTAVDTNKAK